MIFWILSIVQGHAISIWHWPIRKHLDLSFIWVITLQMHLVDNWTSSWLFYYLLLHRADETQPGRNSCPTLQFLAFGLDSIKVAVTLSCRRSNQPRFIVLFLFSADQMFYISYVYQQHFRFQSLASFVFWGRDDGDGGGSVFNGVLGGSGRDADNGCGIGSVASGAFGGWGRCDGEDDGSVKWW